MGRAIQHRVQVDEFECDAAGYALKTSYVGYVEAVVAQLWESALGSWRDLAQVGFKLDLQEVRLRYLGAAELDQELKLEARVVGIDAGAITTEIEATADGRAVASACAQHVLIDSSSRNPAAVRAYVEAALAPYLYEREAGQTPVAPGL